MGGAQPLAAVMAGAHCLAIECQESRIEKRLETRYLDRRASSLDEALEIIRPAKEPTSVGVLGNAAEILPEMVKRGIRRSEERRGGEEWVSTCRSRGSP